MKCNVVESDESTNEFEMKGIEKQKFSEIEEYMFKRENMEKSAQIQIREKQIRIYSTSRKMKSVKDFARVDKNYHDVGYR